MTNKTKNILKGRSKLTKYFYRNGQRESDRNKVLEKSRVQSELLLRKRKKIVALNDQTSEWRESISEVPHRSMLYK